jgi:hypothetical protein
MDAHGRLSIDAAKVAAEAKFDGKFVVTTNDDTLKADDVPLGCTSMTLIEGCFRHWRTIRHTLDQLKVVRYRMQGKTIVQSTQVPLPMAEILQSLNIPLPKKILEVFE